MSRALSGQAINAEKQDLASLLTSHNRPKAI